MLISWNDDFALGYDIIDAGHHLVIEAVNRINEAEENECGRAVAREMLAVVEDHFKRQFAHEEALMLLSRSVSMIAHKAEHQDALAMLAALRPQVDDPAHGVTMVLMNLVAFLNNHLRGSDVDEFGSGHGYRRAA